MPGVDRQPSVGTPCALDELECGPEIVDVDVEGHELIGDGRVGVLGGVVAKGGERPP